MMVIKKGMVVVVFLKKYKLEIGLIIVFIAGNVVDYLLGDVSLKSVAMIGIALTAIYAFLSKNFKI